jgi:PRC-barrel domain
MEAIRGDKLLELPVRLHGIQLGRPSDLLLDRDELKVLGVDVVCGDEIHRFLPLPTASVERGELAIRSPLVLLEEDELAFYRARAFTLRSLRGREVARRSASVGALKDIVIGADGTVTELVVTSKDGETLLPYDASLRIVPGSRSAA